ncbi:MAG: FIST N-terminal domain-containing protein [Vulcanococcus sp.]
MRRILRPREVAAAVEEAWTGLALPHDPRLVIVLAAPRYPLETVAELLSARLGEVPLIGCTSSGEIGGGGALTQSLVLWRAAPGGQHRRRLPLPPGSAPQHGSGSALGWARR